MVWVVPGRPLPVRAGRGGAGGRRRRDARAQVALHTLRFRFRARARAPFCCRPFWHVWPEVVLQEDLHLHGVMMRHDSKRLLKFYD